MYEKTTVSLSKTTVSVTKASCDKQQKLSNLNAIHDIITLSTSQKHLNIFI